jgi:predicted dithiol-disulfide oxidoreductase (DUF899 family)
MMPQPQETEANVMAEHKVGMREEWLADRLKLLEAKKDLARRSDELAHYR